jgi:tetratricopeptide (TPR) repeat protein
MRRAGLAFGMLAFVASASAQEGAPAKPRFDFTGASDTELWAAYGAAIERQDDDYCGFFVPLLSQIETRGGADKQVSIARSGAELECAIQQRHWDVAYRQVKYLERAREKLPPLYTASIARLAGALPDAATRLLEHIDAIEPGTASKLESRELWELGRAFAVAGQSAERLKLLRDLTEEPRLGKMTDDDREGLLSALFAAEVEGGSVDKAAGLVGNVRNPYTMLSALGDRRYAPLWPRLEAQAGDNLHLLLNAAVAEAAAKYESAPGDSELLQKLAHAYLRAGQFSEVVDLVEAKRPPPGKIAEIDEDMAWALNVEAYALDALGRPDDAEALFDQLAAIPFDAKDKGWLVSFVINRGSRLVDLGRFEKGLAAAELAAGIAEKSGSGYARMLVRRDRICALAALGRAAEFAPILQEVDTNIDEAPRVAAEALLCAKEEDKVEALVIAELKDPAKAGEMVEALQGPEFDLFYTASVLPSLSERMRSRKDVDAAFRKVARAIPARFAPLFGKRRAELAASGAGAAGD